MRYFAVRVPANKSSVLLSRLPSPLLLSMLNWRFRAKDSPALWSTHIANWWSWRRSTQLSLKSISLLTALEIFVLMSIVSAWIISLLKEF